MPWWGPQLGCFLAGLVYGVVCTMLVHGARELERLRNESSRKLRVFPVDRVALGSMVVYQGRAQEQEPAGGPCVSNESVGRSLWASGDGSPASPAIHDPRGTWTEGEALGDVLKGEPPAP